MTKDVQFNESGNFETHQRKILTLNRDTAVWERSKLVEQF